KDLDALMRDRVKWATHLQELLERLSPANGKSFQQARDERILEWGLYRSTIQKPYPHLLAADRTLLAIKTLEHDITLLRYASERPWTDKEEMPASAIAQTVIQLWLTEQLAAVLNASFATHQPLPRAEFDRLFYALYPPRDATNML